MKFEQSKMFLRTAYFDGKVGVHKKMTKMVSKKFDKIMHFSLCSSINELTPFQPFSSQIDHRKTNSDSADYYSRLIQIRKIRDTQMFITFFFRDISCIKSRVARIRIRIRIRACLAKRIRIRIRKNWRILTDPDP